jgi:hypothetical protein
MIQEVTQRVKSSTPAFFKKLRNIGLVLTGVAAAILTAPVGLPLLVTNLAGYLAVAGASISAISQLTTQVDGGATPQAPDDAGE